MCQTDGLYNTSLYHAQRWTAESRASSVYSRFQVFPSAFSTLFCYSGWSQIVRVIWAAYAYLVFVSAVNYTNYIWKRRSSYDRAIRLRKHRARVC